MTDQVVDSFYVGIVTDHYIAFQNGLGRSWRTVLSAARTYANEVQFSRAIAIVMPLKAVF